MKAVALLLLLVACGGDKSHPSDAGGDGSTGGKTFDQCGGDGACT